MAVELDESLLVLRQLGSARHLVDLPLQDGDLAVSPGLTEKTTTNDSFRRIKAGLLPDQR